MSKSTKTPRPATTFEHNGKYSKSKNYNEYLQLYLEYEIVRIKLLRMCKNCKMPYGKHNGRNCPEYYERTYKLT